MGLRIEKLREIIEERDVQVTVHPGGDRLRMGCNGRHGKWNCMVLAPDDAETMRVYAVIPVKVPEYKRAAIAEFITRANFRITGSRFEMDFSDGEVLCESDCYIGEGTVDKESFLWMINAAFYATDHYLPGLLRVISSDTSPAKAMAELEEGDKAVAVASMN